jgi:hypothetical protein
LGFAKQEMFGKPKDFELSQTVIEIYQALQTLKQNQSLKIITIKESISGKCWDVNRTSGTFYCGGYFSTQ